MSLEVYIPRGRVKALVAATSAAKMVKESFIMPW